MSNPTATVNGVVLTEAQVQEAVRQIETTKAITTLSDVLVDGGTDRYLYLSPKVVSAIAKVAKDYPGRYVSVGISGSVFGVGIEPKTLVACRATPLKGLM